MWRSLFLSLVLSANAAAGPKITLVIGEKAHALDKAAAEQLATDFKALFEAETSIQSTAPAGAEHVVLVGSPQSNPAIAAIAWPKITEQGIVIKSTPKGLIIGGGCPPATVWAASELAHHFGIRHLLQGDVLPVEKPAFKLEGLDIVMEPKIQKRGWSMFNGIATGAESWGKAEHLALLKQIVKLKYNHVLLPKHLPPPTPVAVEGDVGGRKAFGGAKVFPSGEAIPDLTAEATALGLVVVTQDFVTLGLGARSPTVLPQITLDILDRRLHTLIKYNSGGFLAGAQIPGDLNVSAYFSSRVSFDEKATASSALKDLVQTICGEGVDERVQKAMDLISEASKLIDKNDPALGAPTADVLLRHLKSKEPLPAWITEAKTLYTSAMSEMFRANTRAREGARSFTLYHAKRLEFTVHFFTALEALYKAHDAATRDESLEAAVEGIYNALNSWSDVARDSSDRGAIALLNEFGYRALLKASEGETK
ncbi:MAG: hypothetical protein V4662_12850 [Verrucomicrobiota bacterium]